MLVEDYAAEGKSLARVEGKVIFIEDVVPGDVVDIRLGKIKKTGPKHGPFLFVPFLKTVYNHSAGTLVFAVDASGKCCPITGNSFINKSRFMITLRVSANFHCLSLNQ